MLKTQVKMAWRNFLKNRRYTLINMAGLSVALTIFLLAILFRNNEGRYERWNPGHQDVYRISWEGEGEIIPLAPRPFAAAVRELPITEAATSVSNYWRGQLLITSEDKQWYGKDIITADSSFLDVFRYPLLFGNRTKALREPHTVVLSRAFSETLFGKDVDPVGKPLNMGEFGLCTVTGEIDCSRFPSHIPFNCIISREFHSDDWTSNNTYVYVRCRPKTIPNSFGPELDKQYAELALAAVHNTADLASVSSDELAKFRDDVTHRHYRFSPADAIHLDSNVKYEWKGNGTGRYVRLMLLVALIIVIMASINYTNLSVAYATRRAKETGLRKIVGARRSELVAQFLMETFLQCFLAFVFALVIAELILPLMNSRLGLDLNGWDKQELPSLLSELMISILCTTILAGLYPALVMSGYVPAVVLKGHVSRGTKGIRLRRVLLVAQFASASFFISGIFIILQQISFLRHMDLGYNAAQVLALQVHDEHTNNTFGSVRQKLAAIPGVSAVSRTSQIQGEPCGGNYYDFGGKEITSDFLSVDAGYCAAMGLPLRQGREFDGPHLQDTFGSLVVNETFAKTAGIKAAGESVGYGSRQMTVIGIVKDFHVGNPEEGVGPLALQLLHGNPENYILVRMEAGNASATLKKIGESWADIEPGYPIQYSFLDEHFAGLLRSQEQFGFLFSVLTGTAVLLALMGVVALASYTAERKTKEISIRKVLGANVGQILALLNKDFIRWVLVANVLALPLSRWLAMRWLQGFAFRISPGPEPFVFAAVASLLATVAIVSVQCLRVSTATPVTALKYE